MWSIGEVKSEGWRKLKNYYWPALAVTFITGLFTGGGSGTSGLKTAMSGNENAAGDFIGNGGIPLSFLLLWAGLTTVILVVGIVMFFLKFFVGNPLAVGQCRFFMESRGSDRPVGVGRLFFVFNSGQYWNVVKIMFLRDLYTLLWTFLLIIPGIIKGYEYAMIPYILSENPEADTKDVFALTKDMMDDNKFNLFLLELSFIGWILLGVLTCGIGMFFLAPYMVAAVTEVYASMRKNIGGFPFNGFGMPEEPNVYRQVYEDNDNN